MADLAPKCRFITAKALEKSVIKFGQTKKTARKVLSVPIAPGLKDFDYLAPFFSEH